ncbi:MAG TPA: peptidylprolyl isomerase [Aggregatilineaceae bacterium]|nr:peptidylprolyl isomerase [Aggregatilineaceae bacterium]
MSQAKDKDTVRVHYHGRLEDGSVFGASPEQEPLEFTIGEGQVIAGFEQAVIGMQPGEAKTVQIPAEQAYGEYEPQRIMAIPREQFPSHIEPELGMRLEARQADGQVIPVALVDMTDEQIMLDANHPLAGHALTFDIRLVEIK